MTSQEIIKDQMEKEAIRQEVRERFPHIDFPNVTIQPVMYGRREKTLCQSRVAVAVEGHEPFSFVSPDYNLIYHEEVVKSVLDAVESLDAYGIPECNISLPMDGARLRMEVVFPEVNHEVRKGDKINPKIDAFSSYDTGWKLRSKFGAFQVV